MPGAGTDKTKRWIEQPAPIVVLVEPQLGENIGAAARAMANFGLSRLRLVKPLRGWPNEKARVMAAGADRVLEGVQLYDSLADAIGDCSFVLAATARNHDQAKPVIGASAAAAEMAPRVAAAENVAVVFGRERNGLENHEVARADRILTLPVNPAFASLNLAQAVVIVGYEWFKQAGGELPFHLLRLRAQHRLAEAAELAGQRGLDFVGDLGVVAGFGERVRRVAGREEDLQRRPFLVQRARQLETAHSRHHHIGQQQINRLAAAPADGERVARLEYGELNRWNRTANFWRFWSVPSPRASCAMNAKSRN